LGVTDVSDLFKFSFSSNVVQVSGNITRSHGLKIEVPERVVFIRVKVLVLSAVFVTS
jgi:hypothetical protein